jgi:hypothetical protein
VLVSLRVLNKGTVRIERKKYIVGDGSIAYLWRSKAFLIETIKYIRKLLLSRINQI